MGRNAHMTDMVCLFFNCRRSSFKSIGQFELWQMSFDVLSTFFELPKFLPAVLPQCEGGKGFRQRCYCQLSSFSIRQRNSRPNEP